MPPDLAYYQPSLARTTFASNYFSWTQRCSSSEVRLYFVKHMRGGGGGVSVCVCVVGGGGVQSSFINF